MKEINVIVALAAVVSAYPLTGVVAGSSPLPADEQSPSAVNIQIREYVAENNRRISVSSRGNLIGFESPGGFEHLDVKRPREGYVLAYQPLGSATTLVAYDTFDIFSSNIKSGTRDFVPVSFVAPPSLVNIPYGDLITAVAVVETSDRRLRLTSRIDWVAGSEAVLITMTIQNRSSGKVRLVTVKRHIDVDTDGGGLLGKGPPDANLVVGTPFRLSLVGRPCYCPPPAPGPPPRMPFSEPTDVVTLSASAATISTSAAASMSAASSSPVIPSISGISNDQGWQSPSVGVPFIGKMELQMDTQQTLSWSLNRVLNRLQSVKVQSELAAR
jgi:hypothetical protein